MEEKEKSIFKGFLIIGSVAALLVVGYVFAFLPKEDADIRNQVVIMDYSICNLLIESPSLQAVIRITASNIKRKLLCIIGFLLFFTRLPRKRI